MRTSLAAELEELQGGCCGICGGHARDKLVVDHDHDNGFIRGLLCSSCNNHEGRHPECEDTAECPVCLWRRTPAVAWLGRTEHYQTSSGYPPVDELHFRRRPWAPAETRAARNREQSERSMERTAAAMDRMFGGAA